MTAAHVHVTADGLRGGCPVAGCRWNIPVPPVKFLPPAYRPVRPPAPRERIRTRRWEQR